MIMVFFAVHFTLGSLLCKNWLDASTLFDGGCAMA